MERLDWYFFPADLFVGAHAHCNKKVGKRLSDISWYTQKDRLYSLCNFAIMLALLLLSLWVPLKIGTWWFYVGPFVYIASFAGKITAHQNYATTPQDTHVEKRIFRISRNPLYLFYSTAMLGMVIASVSFPFLLVWVIYNISTHYVIVAEERYCLETYGRDYQEYMGAVPRYLFLI